MANRGDFGLRLTVAHEKWGDTFRGQAKQLFAAMVPDRFKKTITLNLLEKRLTIPNPLQKYDLSDSLQYWNDARFYDDLYLWTGDFQYRRLRDQYLRKILTGSAPFTDPNRKGNSLRDLRLSLRGFAFNDWVKANPHASVSDTSAQLRRLITSDSPPPSSIKGRKFPRPIPR